MEEVIKFHDWLEKIGNIYLADFQRMDRAYQRLQNNNEDCITFAKNDETVYADTND